MNTTKSLVASDFGFRNSKNMKNLVILPMFIQILITTNDERLIRNTEANEHHRRKQWDSEMFYPPRLYIGSYNQPHEKGITIFEMDTEGKFQILGGHVTRNPVNLVADRSGRFIYCGNEKNGDPRIKVGKITTYAIGNPDLAEEDLSTVNWLDAQGTSPAYVTLDESGRFVVSVNHDTGRLVVMALDQNGELDFIAHVYEAPAFDPHAARGHMVAFHPTQRNVVAVSYVGLDRIYFYNFDNETGKLSPLNIDVGPRGGDRHLHAQLDHGAGPRHFVFSNDGRFLYALGEESSTVTVFKWHSYHYVSSINYRQILSTVPTDYEQGSFGAEIALHPNGKFLYASNRGHDSIAIFRVNRISGFISPVDFIETGGQTPRHFIILPDGRQLIVGNQNSDSVEIFDVNSNNGLLTHSYTISDYIQQPSFVLYTESKLQHFKNTY